MRAIIFLSLSFYLTSNFLLISADTCAENPCLNNGKCVRNGTNIHCECPSTHFGKRCEKRNCNDLRHNPCENGGQCELTPVSLGHRFKCDCPLGYQGYTCGVKLPTSCDSKPCGKHGECHLTASISDYECKCHTGFIGKHCEQRDHCSDNPCLSHGECTSTENGYECKCFHGWMGEQCQLDVDECQGEPCEHGTCVNQEGYYYCQCPNEYYGKNCEWKRKAGCETNPCMNGGHCLEEWKQRDGKNFKCACPAGFTGERCEVNIDDCHMDGINVCVNGGYCIDGVANYTCKCPPGFTGTNCEKDVDECRLFGNSLCQNGGTCINEHGGYKCICISGFNGSHCEQNIDDCAENMCFPGSTCIDAVSNYYCECVPGRMGMFCEYEDPCYGKNNKCKYGKCTRNEVTNNFTCSCDNGYEGRNCDQDIDECAFPDACFKGTCINTKGSFVCKCEPGFTGQLCNEMINECEPNPCKNGATCLDDIGRFICVCMPEYTGLYCETRVNKSGNFHCTLPCENGGLCRNSTKNPYCECPPPFTGPFCGQPKPDPCLRSNCTNGATCMPTSDYESFTCQCSPGYTGDKCQILAAGCSQKPCKHGTCQATNEDEYYCNCESGYTGINCDINIDDCADNPCLNNGFCLDRIGSFLCVCPADTTGALCESKIHRPCENHACQNGALCVAVDNSYECRCNKGFAGKFCELDVDECASVPCQNKGRCVDLVNGFFCECQSGFTGARCEQNVDECRNVKCQNGGKCVDGINSFKCVCPKGFYGTYCEAYTDVEQFWRNDDVDKKDCEKFECTEKANNGVCNEECNRFACNYDGGDCALKNGDPFAECTAASYCARAFGDKKCDQICDNEACLFDGFDCHLGHRCANYEYCSTHYANGKCDPMCNVANCGWDGGDCALTPKQHDLLPGDLVLILRVDESTFRAMINRFLLNLSWDLRSTIRLRLDKDGRPMIYHWHSESGQGKLLEASGLNLTGFMGVTRDSEEVYAQHTEHTADQSGIMVYLQIDVGMCRESYSSFDCFTNIENTASYLSAANAKKELDDLGIPIYSASSYRPSPESPQSWNQYIFAFGLCVLFVMFTATVLILPKSRKRKLTAPIWHPPIQNKDNDSFRGSALFLGGQQGLQHPLIDPTTCAHSITSSDYCGDNKNYIKSSASTPNGNTLDSKKPKYDAKLTALHEQAGSQYCIQPSLINREDLFKRDSRGRTPLHWVVDSHFEKTEEMIMRDVDLLIGAGADVSALDNEDRTPLHLAVRRAREQVALKLLEHKAEILNVGDIEDRTPLYDAVCVKSAKVVCAILHLSNDEKMVNTVVGRNDTALKACVALTHEPAMPILRMLLEHKANPNLAGDDKSPTYEGKTPLHIAASVNNHTFIRPLVLNGANKDAQDSMGRTPLFVAAENGHLESCMELLRLGASKDIADELSVSKEIAPDCAPRTPQLVAIENGYLELARRIENFVHEPEQLNSCDGRAPSRMRTNDEETAVPAKRAKKSPKTTRNTKQKDKEIGNMLTPPHSDKSYSYTPSPQMGMSLHPVSHPPQTVVNFQPGSANPHSADSGNGITSSPASQSPDTGYQSGSMGWSPTEDDEKTLINSDPGSKTWTLHSNSVATNVSPHTSFEAPSAQCLNKPEHYFKQLSPPYEPNNSQINVGASTSASFDPYTATSIFQDTPSAHMQSPQAYGYPNDQLFYQNSGYFNSPFMGVNPQMAMFYNPLRKPENPPTYNQYYSNPST